MGNEEERNAINFSFISGGFCMWVDSELSEEFEIKVGMNHGSLLSSFLFPCGGRCCHIICQRGCAK